MAHNACRCSQATHCGPFLEAMQQTVERLKVSLGDRSIGHPSGQWCDCDARQLCGPIAWTVLHEWAQAVHDQICPHCGEWAIDAASAVHDLVNIKLGKPVQDPEALTRFCGEVRQAEASQGAAPGSVLAVIDDKIAAMQQELRPCRLMSMAQDGTRSHAGPSAGFLGSVGAAFAVGLGFVLADRVARRIEGQTGAAGSMPFVEHLRRGDAWAVKGAVQDVLDDNPMAPSRIALTIALRYDTEPPFEAVLSALRELRSEGKAREIVSRTTGIRLWVAATRAAADMSAQVVHKDGQWCVAHDVTGQVLERQGRRVCFDSREEAQAEALATRCRVMGGPDCPTAGQKFPVCTPAQAERRERCIRHLKDRPEVDSPHAVCTSSIGCRL